MNSKNFYFTVQDVFPTMIGFVTLGYLSYSYIWKKVTRSRVTKLIMVGKTSCPVNYYAVKVFINGYQYCKISRKCAYHTKWCVK